MSLWTRIANVFRADRLSSEIDEELESHLAEAIEQGRDPAEARRAFGATLRTREECRDFRMLGWLDSLRKDSIFGWRQLKKRKVTSAVAVLSLGLAIGACTSAFRLIDALLLRPLPVASPEQLYAVAREKDGITGDSWAYPAFLQMRAAVKGDAELLAVSDALPLDVTFRSDEEMEKATVQYVSGWMFGSFGLHPAAGRLLTGEDDVTPGAHPYAVLSFDYWSRRFGRDPHVVGRSFHMGEQIYEIVGVGPEPFTGTETGAVTDIFLPATMHAGAVHDDWTWHRTLARVRPGAAMEPLRAKLDATSRAFEEERSKGFTGMSREAIRQFLDLRVILTPAAAGASGLQQNYRTALIAIGVLVAMVLLIACANVANLMTAQAASRAREMALRVSIGAGRGRLLQLVLVESAWLAFLSAGLGATLSWWSAPFVVSRISRPGNPVRLAMPADWRVLAFGIGLALAVTLLFGLAPALRASKVNPASALRGAGGPHSRRRLMHGLIAVQVAFCFLVLFMAGLFATTFDHLSNRPMGFSAERVLTLDTVAQRAQPQVYWDQVAEHLRAMPGVETVALAGWALLADGGWNGFVSVNGAPPGPDFGYFMKVSPGWIDAMKVSLIEGRDFRPDDATPGAAIVNETFVRQFLHGERAVGTAIAKGELAFRIVGVVRDLPYRNLREAILPVIYVPFRSDEPTRQGTFVVRTASANPLALASMLRREVPRARPEFRVSTVRSEAELVNGQTIRERLVAMLALFFAAVALLLAGIGLYGVLDYSVLQRRREIGIRMAVGAQAGDIARRVTADVFGMVLAGAAAGLALGIAFARYVAALLYQVKPTDVAMLALPAVLLLAGALIAALPAVIHAVRIDPGTMLRQAE